MLRDSFLFHKIWDAYMNSGESYSALTLGPYLGHMHASQTVVSVQ